MTGFTTNLDLSVDLVEFCNQLDDSARRVIEVEDWGVRVQAHGMKLVALLHSQPPKRLEVLPENGLFHLPHAARHDSLCSVLRRADTGGSQRMTHFSSSLTHFEQLAGPYGRLHPHCATDRLPVGTHHQNEHLQLRPVGGGGNLRGREGGRERELTLYQPMMHVTSWILHNPIEICMKDLILGGILQYTVSASFSCFLWLVKG